MNDLKEFDSKTTISIDGMSFCLDKGIILSGFIGEGRVVECKVEVETFGNKEKYIESTNYILCFVETRKATCILYRKGQGTQYIACKNNFELTGSIDL